MHHDLGYGILVWASVILGMDLEGSKSYLDLDLFLFAALPASQC